MGANVPPSGGAAQAGAFAARPRRPAYGTVNFLRMAAASMPGPPHEPSPLPLRGRRILVTRPGTRGERLARDFEALGADARHVPLTRIETVDREGLAWRLASGGFDWVIFTSANGVHAAADAARASSGTSLRDTIGRASVAAVGRVTAETLHDAGVAPVVVPGRFDAEALLEAMAARDDVRGSRILHPAAAGASQLLGAGLAALGAEVETVIAYASVPDAAGAAALRAMLQDASLREPAPRHAGPIDLVTFLAPSAVDAYAEAVGQERRSAIPAASIGPVTTAAVAAQGIPLAVEAKEATAERLVDAVAGYFVLLHSKP